MHSIIIKYFRIEYYLAHLYIDFLEIIIVIIMVNRKFIKFMEFMMNVKNALLDFDIVALFN